MTTSTTYLDVCLFLSTSTRPRIDFFEGIFFSPLTLFDPPPLHCWFLLSKLLNENLGNIKCNSENIWIPLCYAVFLQAYVWNGAHNFYETFFLPFFAAVRSSFIKSCVQILFFVKENRAFWVKGFLAMQFQIAEYWSWLLSPAFRKIIRALTIHMTWT